jgi:hypothetical protein
MSDSLSMTSALALGGAAGAAGKALEKARSMFNATNELSFLINEVSNIQLIMVGLVEELRLRKERNTFQVQLTDALATLLRATTEELQELEKVIYYDLVKYGEKNEIHANKIAWAQEQRKIQGFRTRLRNHRMNLVAQVGVVTL